MPYLRSILPLDPVQSPEPWSIVFTDLDTGTIIDVVDGRRGKAVAAWMAQRPESWKRNIDYVAGLPQSRGKPLKPIPD